MLRRTGPHPTPGQMLDPGLGRHPQGSCSRVPQPERCISVPQRNVSHGDSRGVWRNCHSESTTTVVSGSTTTLLSRARHTRLTPEVVRICWCLLQSYRSEFATNVVTQILEREDCRSRLSSGPSP